LVTTEEEKVYPIDDIVTGNEESLKSYIEHFNVKLRDIGQNETSINLATFLIFF